MPWAAAAMTMGSTPGTGRRAPATDSSPMNAHPSSRSGVSSSCFLSAAMTAIAIARS